MKHFPPEPLSPEERELAQLAARLGPQGEPSPALDARILSAAHAALDRKPAARQKPRWPVAMGLAASVVFAVGIAWQLRPLQEVQTMTASEAPAPVIPSPDDTRTPVETSSGTADSAGAAMAEPAAVEMIGPATPASAPSQAPVVVAAPPPPPEVTAVTQARELRAQSERRARSQRAAAAPVLREARVADAYQPPSPPAPPAPASMAVPAPEEEPTFAFAPDPHAEAAAGSDSASLGVTGNLRSAQARPAATAVRQTAAKSITANALGRAQERESANLERIEVTGSRQKRTDLLVPVSDDARLPVSEWLERVRTRYGLGDAGAAKKSLLLFVKDHPGEAVPGDLEPLLEK